MLLIWIIHILKNTKKYLISENKKNFWTCKVSFVFLKKLKKMFIMIFWWLYVYISYELYLFLKIKILENIIYKLLNNKL